jgi:hypothetical protein
MTTILLVRPEIPATLYRDCARSSGTHTVGSKARRIGQTRLSPNLLRLFPYTYLSTIVCFEKEKFTRRLRISMVAVIILSPVIEALADTPNPLILRKVFVPQVS